jgi:acetyl esterase/lipase
LRRDLAELRRQYDFLSSQFGAMPQDVTFEAAQLGPIRGEWVRLNQPTSRRLILYFHGGGYVAGSPETHRPLIGRLCLAAQATAFVPAYRLAPEFGFPAGLRDAIDAYRHLLQRGISPSSVALAGDAAGGGLAFALLLAIRNAGLPMPAACAAMSPWADLSLSGWSMMDNAHNDTALSWDILFVSARHYLKKNNPTDPYASPVFAQFRDYPPIMVHAGSREILRDDASRIGERAAEANVPVSVEIYDGMEHVFQGSPRIPEARVSLGRLGQFIRARTAEGEGTVPALRSKAGAEAPA